MNKLLLSAALPLAAALAAACSPRQAAPQPAEPSATLRPGEAPQASAQPPEKAPQPPAPAANETLYVAHVVDAAGRPVARVKVMILTKAPEGLEMREPRRKTVINTYVSPLHGQVFFKTEADNKPKFLWFGGSGIHSFIKELPASTPGGRFENTYRVEILPIAHLVILDHAGNRVANAIVTMKPVLGESKLKVPGNYGNTQRSDSAGEVEFTRAKGRYLIIANKANGKNRLEQEMDWNGDPGPIEIRLPQ